MAGHSKWANIKHRKAAQDKKRGKALYEIDKGNNCRGQARRR